MSKYIFFIKSLPEEIFVNLARAKKIFQQIGQVGYWFKFFFKPEKATFGAKNFFLATFYYPWLKRLIRRLRKGNYLAQTGVQELPGNSFRWYFSHF